MIEASERFDKQISTLVVELIATSNEKVERLVEVKVVVTVKVPSNKAMNLFLCSSMQVLELVKGAELLYI